MCYVFSWFCIFFLFFFSHKRVKLLVSLPMLRYEAGSFLLFKYHLFSLLWVLNSLLFQVTSCEHVFCKACLRDYSSSLGQVSCPSCSKLLTVDLTSKPETSNRTSKTTIKGFRSSSILNRVQLDDFQTSTKIEALVCMVTIIN